MELPFKNGSSIAILGYNLAKELAARHEVIVFCGGGSPNGDMIKSENITVCRLPAKFEKIFKLADRLTGIFEMSPPLMTRLSYYNTYFSALAEKIAAERFDVIHLCTFFQVLPRLRLAAPQAALVLHMHGETASLAPESVVAPAISSADLFLGCSGYIVDRMSDRWPQLATRSAVLWNGVSVVDVPERENAADTTLRVLYVGRVSPEKGLHVLIDAFSRLADERHDIELDIVGAAGLLPYSYHLGISTDSVDWALRPFYGNSLVEKFQRQTLGNQSSYLSDLARLIKPSLASRIQFLGQVPHNELGKLYASAAVFVFPSVWNEPFGMPVAEAMAAGVPVVSTRGGGIPEIIDDGETGVLVPRDDADALVAAIGTLLDDADLRQKLGTLGRERIRTEFAWPILAQKLEGFYYQALNARNSTSHSAS